MKRLALGLAVAAAAVGLAACSDADVASDNLSKEAEQFRVVRRIVGINGITDKVLFEVTGRCSLEMGDSMAGVLDVICKEPDGTYVKHYVGMSDNVTFVSTQLEGVDVSTVHTKFIFKPESIVPDVDLVTGENSEG